MSFTNQKQFFAAISLVCTVISPTPAVTQEKTTEPQSEARAVIDRAIKAHGGEENLSKFKAVSSKWEGKSKVENFYWDSTTSVIYQMPDKVRFDSEIRNPNGGKFSRAMAVNGTKGWRGPPTKARDLKDSDVAQILDDL